jgi:hypothetical protein
MQPAVLQYINAVWSLVAIYRVRIHRLRARVNCLLAEVGRRGEVMREVFSTEYARHSVR